MVWLSRIYTIKVKKVLQALIKTQDCLHLKTRSVLPTLSLSQGCQLFSDEYGQIWVLNTASYGQTKKGVQYKGNLLLSAFYSIFITKLLAELPKNGEKIFSPSRSRKYFWSNFWIRPEKARFWENLWIRPEKARFFRIRPYGQNFFSAARQVQIRPKRPNLAARAASWQLW